MPAVVLAVTGVGRTYSEEQMHHMGAINEVVDHAELPLGRDRLDDRRRRPTAARGVGSRCEHAGAPEH